MHAVLQLSVKDLKLLLRDRLAAFFIIVFPVLMGLFFGVVFEGGGSGPSSAMQLLVCDEDQSELSTKLLEYLAANEHLEIQPLDHHDAAIQEVRSAKAVACLKIPAGYGETAGIPWKEPVALQLNVDPSRSAEVAMLEGFLMEASGQLVMANFQDPDQIRKQIAATRQQLGGNSETSPMQQLLLTGLFNNLDALMESVEQVQKQNADGTTGFQLANIETIPVTAPPEENEIRPSGFEVSFPQGMIWGALACSAGFAISMARERSRGTLVRLRASPLTVSQILLGKAVACFITVLVVQCLMIGLGIGLGMRVHSGILLAISAVLTSACFVGIMMTMSVLGRTEESVSGSGWAVNMVMAMLGGAMVPFAFLPPFFKTLSIVSPVRWAIFSLEGAIWRQLTLAELWIPWSVLLTIAVLGFWLGSTKLKRDWTSN